MADDLLGELRGLVMQLVEGRTAMGAIALSGVVLESSYRLKVIPDRDTLDATVTRLVEGRLVRETSDGSLLDARSNGGSFAHARISEQAYESIIEQHYAGYRHDPEMNAPRTPVLQATIPVSGSEPTLLEWRRTESIAVALVDALKSQRRSSVVTTINAGAGVLNFQLLASADYDPRRIQRLVAPVFAAASPAGSALDPILIQLP